MLELTGAIKIAYGDVTGIDSATKFSVAMWLRIGAFASAGGIMGKGTAFRIINYPATGQIAFQTAGTGYGHNTSASDFPANSLHHLAFTYDGTAVGNANRLQMYVDGVSKAMTYPAGIDAALGDAGAAAVFVGWESVNAVSLTSSFGQLRAWTDWLTAAQVVQEMNSWRPVKMTNLVLWMPYDDALLGTDFSSLKNTPTVTGTPVRRQYVEVSYD